MRLFLLLFLSLVLASGCDRVLLGEPEPNTVLTNFDLLWQDYAAHYANFRVKQLDWDDAYNRYRPLLNESSSEDDLYQVFVDMLTELNDGHVSLLPYGSGFSNFTSGVSAQLENTGAYVFDPKLVATRYLEAELGNFEDEIIHGILPDNIGYLYIGLMYEDQDFWRERMDQIIADLKDTRGLVLDIRNNGGGEDETGRLLASYFTDTEPIYQQTRYKTGPKPDDFEALRIWRILRTDAPKYTLPIVLLTDRYTISAGETFALAMRNLPQTTHVGDTTNGAFSDVVDRELPNRWVYRISVSEVFDQDGTSWEGIGLPPVEVIRNTPAEVAAGVDPMLEAALAYF